jgi:hypothetical protein
MLVLLIFSEELNERFLFFYSQVCVNYCSSKMNSKTEIPVHLPMYYLSLIPTKIANTVEVSGNEG